MFILRRAWTFIAMLLVGAALPNFCRADSATQPTGPIKTGEFQCTFTDRSPLSAPGKIAARLKLDEKDLGDDYDLSQRPFWVYVPSNYDAATAYGIVVYLGYKDSVSTPALWQPVADKTHLILITPVCHSGPNYPPPVPAWQTTGLALDAVYNLKRQYNIDNSRIYQMSWNTGAMQAAIATSDVFTGFMIALDPKWFRRLQASNGGFYKPYSPAPSDEQLEQAHHRAFFLIDIEPPGGDALYALRTTAMKRGGFTYIQQNTQLSLSDDLHYPMFKSEWFEQDALPFLDAASAAEAKLPQQIPVTAPAPISVAAPAPMPAPTATQATASAKPPVAATAPTAPSQAQHLLTLSQMYIDNSQPDLARRNLHRILDEYPKDPAAEKARKMLEQIGDH
jgi:hypothetical protein